MLYRDALVKIKEEKLKSNVFDEIDLQHGLGSVMGSTKRFAEATKQYLIELEIIFNKLELQHEPNIVKLVDAICGETVSPEIKRILNYIFTVMASLGLFEQAKAGLMHFAKEHIADFNNLAKEFKNNKNIELANEQCKLYNLFQDTLDAIANT